MADATHSHKQESEADDYSYDFLKRNGYNVVAEYMAFKKLALLSESADKRSTCQKMLNSDPDSNKHADSAKKAERKVCGKIQELLHCRQLSRQTKGDHNFAATRARIKPSLFLF